MIIHTGNRTDIPAFYAPWFARRLQEGYVLVRQPYRPGHITRYVLDPAVVDLLIFCTKDPGQLLSLEPLLRGYRQYVFVTITPYGRDIEPHVPDKRRVLRDCIALSQCVGPDALVWRYDPILLDHNWTEARHLQAFREMARTLAGHTHVCVVSFIDLYPVVRRRFPEAEAVPFDAQVRLIKALVDICQELDMSLRLCAESARLGVYGADCRGCFTGEILQEQVGAPLRLPPSPHNRGDLCNCYITCDIGQYNTCGHLCRYCYANSDTQAVLANRRAHDPRSPLLIGHVQPGDHIQPARQESWIETQLSLEI